MDRLIAALVRESGDGSAVTARRAATPKRTRRLGSWTRIDPNVKAPIYVAMADAESRHETLSHVAKKLAEHYGLKSVSILTNWRKWAPVEAHEPELVATH